jgi:hypothetical protein
MYATMTNYSISTPVPFTLKSLIHSYISIIISATIYSAAQPFNSLPAISIIIISVLLSTPAVPHKLVSIHKI